MKIFYKIIALTIIFFMGFFLLKEFLDTKIYTNNLCRHRFSSSAILVKKTQRWNVDGSVQDAGCFWRIGDDFDLSEHWFNCDGIKEKETVFWIDSSCSCSHLLKLLESSPDLLVY